MNEVHYIYLNRKHANRSYRACSASVYIGGLDTETWSEVNCPHCLARKPIKKDVAPTYSNPTKKFTIRGREYELEEDSFLDVLPYLLAITANIPSVNLLLEQASLVLTDVNGETIWPLGDLEQLADTAGEFDAEKTLGSTD